MTDEVNFEPEKRFDWPWLASCALVTAAATFLRFFWLTLKPLHHDEGVNGFFLTNLFRDGVYKYDPENYHGPTLYYISLAFTYAFDGLNTTAIRSSVAVFGVLIVILAFFLRRYIGTIGALAAATFLALSPGMVYISRYFIHEIFFIFLALAVVLSIVFFIEKRRAGPFALAWMVLLLLVCFLPSALSLASAILAMLGSTSEVALWSFRGAFILIELVLIYLVVRMLVEWNDGRPVYLLLGSGSVALMFATKETAFITLGTMVIACFCIWLWRPIAASESFQKNKLYILGGATVLALIVAGAAAPAAYGWLDDNFRGAGKVYEPFAFYSILLLLGLLLATWAMFLKWFRDDETTINEPVDLTWSAFRSGVGGGADRWLAIAAVAVVFIYIIVLFFSSFFTYAEGVGKAFEAYSFWTKTGNRDHTQSGWLGYVKWGFKVEAPLLIIGSIGAAIAIAKARHRFAMFAALWAWGLFAAYSIIPYKTPWLAISFYLPMCLIAGYAINELVTSRRAALKIGGAALAVLGSVLLAYQTYQINFVRYDDEEMAYVYAHTKREMLDLVSRIEHYAARSGEGKESSVEIVSPDYWPLTWYLNDYKQAVFHGTFTDANASEMIVAKKNDQDVEMIRRYAAHYKFDGVYPLRPGVDLVLLVNKNIADREAQELYKILEYEDTK